MRVQTKETDVVGSVDFAVAHQQLAKLVALASHALGLTVWQFVIIKCLRRVGIGSDLAGACVRSLRDVAPCAEKEHASTLGYIAHLICYHRNMVPLVVLKAASNAPLPSFLAVGDPPHIFFVGHFLARRNNRR